MHLLGLSHVCREALVAPSSKLAAAAKTLDAVSGSTSTLVPNHAAWNAHHVSPSVPADDRLLGATMSWMNLARTSSCPPTEEIVSITSSRHGHLVLRTTMKSARAPLFSDTGAAIGVPGAAPRHALSDVLQPAAIHEDAILEHDDDEAPDDIAVAA